MLESLALPGETYKLAFTPGLLTQVYGNRVTEAMLTTDGGYVHSEGEATWWIPSGRVFYSPQVTETPAQELAFAQQHFFLPHRSRDPFGNTAFTGYDHYCFLPTQTTDALGNRATMVFDAAGNTLATVDQLGNRTTFVYDELNRVEAASDALGNRATTTFDAAGNVRTVVDQLNRTTTFGYDARNLQVTTTDARGNVWTTQYDELGRAWRRIDPLGHDTRTYFDAAGRAAESADQLDDRGRHLAVAQSQRLLQAERSGIGAQAERRQCCARRLRLPVDSELAVALPVDR